MHPVARSAVFKQPLIGGARRHLVAPQPDRAALTFVDFAFLAGIGGWRVLAVGINGSHTRYRTDCSGPAARDEDEEQMNDR
ncbi:hypothetical protein GCM10027298_24340 [Epidermidibacterium keratini]